MMQTLTMTMTGKYKRKAVPNKLEVRGISRGGGLDYTQGHTADDKLPQGFVDTLNDALYNYDSGSDRSSPTTAQYLEASNNNWTNLTTDRSSSYDSTVTEYDEFDREASKNVQMLFDHIDSTLFETKDSGTSQLFDECRDWNSTFPHLRILGVQLVESIEQGIQAVESPVSRPSTSDSQLEPSSSSFSEALGSGDANSLIIEGTVMRAKSYSAESTSSSEHAESDMYHLQEDVFQLDGHYEDIIAIDSDLHEDAVNPVAIVTSVRQRRSRYPPVTPNACAKDDIVNSVFDVVWNQMTEAMRILLQRYSEHFVITHPMVIAAPLGDEFDAGHVTLPPIITSRIDSITLPGPLPSSRVLPKPNNYNSYSSNEPQLSNLLRIKSMGMTRREKTFEEGIETPLSTLIIGPAVNKKNTRNSSASQRVKPGKINYNKLQPLPDNRGKTPNVDDEVLRGQGFGKRLSSPPMLTRALPPIGFSEPLMLHGTDTTPPPTRGIMHRRGNRASSAIADKDQRILQPEKVAAIIGETRPSTTHTIYPTEQYHNLNHLALQAQRSATPNERSNRIPSNLVLHGSRVIGRPLDEEVEGRLDSVPHHSQWAPPHTANGVYRRNKPLNSSSFVR